MIDPNIPVEHISDVDLTFPIIITWLVIMVIALSYIAYRYKYDKYYKKEDDDEME